MSVTALSVRRLEHTLERIRSSVIGDDTVLDGPFGPRRGRLDLEHLRAELVSHAGRTQKSV